MHKLMHKNVPYIRCRDGIYYFVRRIPDDVKSYYSSDSISMSLRTKSNGIAIRATKWSERKEAMSNQELSKIAAKQTVMVVCHRD